MFKKLLLASVIGLASTGLWAADFNETLQCAKQGDDICQFDLGVMYYNGQGVAKNAKQAVYWFQKSASLGNASAQYNLGIIYENGGGVAKNHKQAVYWYQKAASLGHAKAQLNLGNMYYLGEGVNKSEQMAVYWPPAWLLIKPTAIILAAVPVITPEVAMASACTPCNIISFPKLLSPGAAR